MEFLYNFFVNFLLPFIIILFILFFVMKAAVKSAIDDIDVKIKKESQSEPDQENYDELIKLRDIELLSDNQLEEVISLYQAEKVNKENYDAYIKYSKILAGLKEREYLSLEDYNDKSEKLKRHFNID